VTFKLASYFEAQNGLIVILNVTGSPTEAVTIEAYQATYQPPTGSPIQAATSRGITGNIQPNVAATLELEFTGSPATGGTITIPVLGGASDNFAMGNASNPIA